MKPAKLYPAKCRRGAIVPLTAVMLIVIFALTAFVVDSGYMQVVGTRLQNAADAAALSAIMHLQDGVDAVVNEARAAADDNDQHSMNVVVKPSDIELGKFDLTTRTFVPNDPTQNAVRVTARVVDQGFFVAPAFGVQNFSMSRSAIAMVNPRDIAFVVDLSGSMNDDSEPCWATTAINNQLSGSGYATIGDSLCQQLYSDFKFGAFPGEWETIGQPLGVPGDWYAYAVMTQDDGVLTQSSIPTKYRIDNKDSEGQRKKKAYDWIIDLQLKRLMPNARPVANSMDTGTIKHWEAYLDYLIAPAWVGYWEDTGGGDDGGGGGGGGGDPVIVPPSGFYDRSRNVMPRWFEQRDPFPRRHALPRVVGSVADAGAEAAARLLAGPVVAGPVTPGLPRRGTTDGVNVPEAQDPDRIYQFNNPNLSTFRSANPWGGWEWINRVGYVTFTQYMLDWGRDRAPDLENDKNVRTPGKKKTMLSVENPECPFHPESTAGGTFSFPPSEQPMHATRRALIAALEEVRVKNTGASSGVSDRVALITFDSIDADHQVEVRVPLTANYRDAMQSCTTLQAVSDVGNSTASEYGMAVARQHLKPATEGGQGRSYTTKVIVLLTDGVPNVWQSPDATINAYVSANSSPNFYDSRYPWYNSVLMQTSQAQKERAKVYGVGMGLGADLDFMDRIARLAKTDKGGLSPRGTGNPADYEARLTEIFREIINTRGGRLVQ